LGFRRIGLLRLLGVIRLVPVIGLLLLRIPLGDGDLRAIGLCGIFPILHRQRHKAVRLGDHRVGLLHNRCTAAA